MLMTSQPCDWNQADSARVENRGPWTTTTVPVSWTGSESVRASEEITDRAVGQYGSAKEMCVVTGPS